MGTEVAASVSGASAAESSLQGNIKFGDIIAGGRKIPLAVWIGVLGIVLFIATGWILSRK